MSTLSSNYVAEFNLARSYMVTGDHDAALKRLRLLDAELTDSDGMAGALRAGSPRHELLRPMWVRVRYNLVASLIHLRLEGDGDDAYSNKEVSESLQALCSMLKQVVSWRTGDKGRPSHKRFMKQVEPTLAELILAIDGGSKCLQGEGSSGHAGTRALYNKACRQAAAGQYNAAIATLVMADLSPELKRWSLRDPSFKKMRGMDGCADALDALVREEGKDVDALKGVNARVIEAVASYGIASWEELATLDDNEVSTIATIGGVRSKAVAEVAKLAATAADLGALRYALLIREAGYLPPKGWPNDPAQALKRMKEANVTDDNPFGEFVSPSVLSEQLVDAWQQGREFAEWNDPCDSRDQDS